MSFISVTITLKVPINPSPQSWRKYQVPDKQLPLPTVVLGEAGSTDRVPFGKGLTCTKRFCSPMTRDNTCDILSGARTVFSEAGGGWGPEGTRATRAEEKFCCRAVRRKHKMAAENKNPLYSAPSSFLTSHLALWQGEDSRDNNRVTTGWSGESGPISQSKGKALPFLLECPGAIPESSAAFFFGKLRTFNTWSSSTDSFW